MGLFDSFKKKMDSRSVNSTDGMWRYCPYCGKETQNEWNVCPYCGSALNSSDKSKTEARRATSVQKTDGLIIENGLLVQYTGTAQDIYIPEGVTEITRDVFAYKNIRSVSLPESLTSLGSGCFRGCKQLVRINIPKNVKTINNNAFAGCESLKEFYCSENSITFEGNVFPKCDALADQNGMVIIGSILFSYCKNEEEVVIPEGVTKIAEWTFSHDSKIDHRHENIRKITIPDSVTEIGSGAFMRLRNLEQIVLPPRLNAISNSMFYGCSKLEPFLIPESVERIGDSAFSICEKLKEVVFPASVSVLGKDIFESCYGLEKLRIKGDIKEIGGNIFGLCCGHPEVILDGNVPKELEELVAKIRKEAQEFEEWRRKQEIEAAKPKQRTGNKEELHIFLEVNGIESHHYRCLINWIERTFRTICRKDPVWYETPDTLCATYYNEDIVWHDESSAEDYTVSISRYDGDSSVVKWEPISELPGAEQCILVNENIDEGNTWNYRILRHDERIVRKMSMLPGIWKVKTYSLRARS